MGNQIAYILPFSVYMVILVGVGFALYRNTKTVEDFHLGGRTLGPLLSGISILFSGSSAWIFLGCASMGYLYGPSTWFYLSCCMGAMEFAYLVLGKRVRNYSGILGSITYPEFFVRRVRAKTNIIRLIAASATLIFMTVYVNSQYVAAGKSLPIMFNISFEMSIFITAAVVTAYCLTGGFSAVVWTDFIQGMVILVGSIAIVAFLLVKAGGWREATSALAALDPNLVSVKGASWALILVNLTAGVGAIGRPHDTIRFFALKDSKTARATAVVGECALFINYWTGYMIGYLGRIFFPTLKDPEAIFSTICINMLNPWFAGIMLAALMALIMSTVDSQLLSAASTLSEDFFHNLIKKDASDKELLVVARLSVLLIGVIGVWMALSNNDTVNNLVLFATGGLSATFGPALFLSLYWKKFNELGCICSMIGGFTISVGWYLGGLKASTNVHEAFAGMFGALAIAVAVSLLTQQPHEAEIEAELADIGRDYEGEEMASIEKKYADKRAATIVS